MDYGSVEVIIEKVTETNKRPIMTLQKGQLPLSICRLGLPLKLKRDHSTSHLIQISEYYQGMHDLTP